MTHAHVNKHGPSHVTPKRNLRACQGTQLPPIVPEQWCLGWHWALAPGLTHGLGTRVTMVSIMLGGAPR